MEKNLLITGATSDVGVELLKKVNQEYDHIFLQYRNMNGALRSVVDNISRADAGKLTLLQSDFSDEAEVDKLINNIMSTGINPNHIVHLPSPKPYNERFHKDKWENYQKGWDISVRSIVMILKKFIPQMTKSKHGRIIFMLTSCVNGSPAKYQSSYVTVKYALLGLMRSLAVEYAEKGVTVNGISPEMMDTKFLDELPDILVEQNRAASPLGRNVRLEEVIPVMQYMLSDAGAAMTGQNIAITGGMIRH